MGKTAISLAAIKTLGLKKVLIVAPILAIKNVWINEVKKWRRFNKITCADLHSNKNKTAIINLINPESLHKLRKFEYDLIIIDESTSFKNPSGKRFKFLKKEIRHIKRRVILTGTPTPKGIHDLWSQIFLLDQGKSLYKTITAYRSRFFDCEMSYGFNKYPIYTPKKNAFKKVSKIISPFTLVIKDTKSNEPLFNDIIVDMDRKQRKPYATMEKQLFAEISNQSIFAVNSAVAYNQCQQLANGAIYDEEKKKYLVLHNKKLDALENLIGELQGKNLLVGYRFKHDIDRIKKRFKNAVVITEKNAIDRWNDGEIELLLAQFQSASKALNLYQGGIDVCFFSLTDNYENYIQFIRRLWGINRNRSVRVHRIICDKTVDVAIINRLNDRDSVEKSFLSYLRNYRKMKSYSR